MMNFQTAQARHKTVEMVAIAFPQAGIADGGEDIWNAIAYGNNGPAPLASNLAQQVALMMPAAALPVVRALSHVAAAFAFALMAESFIEAELEAGAKRQPRIGDDEIARRAWDKFEDHRKVAHVFKNGLGCDDSPSWELAIDVQSLPDEAVREAQRVAEMAGKMYEALAAGTTTEVDGIGEVRDVTVGKDISQILGSEIAQLFEPGLDDHAAIKLMEGNMQQYQQMATVPAQRGPLVICSDESGSMGENGRGRLVWSKAVIAAMVRIAWASNRMVHIVHYAHATAVTVLKPGDHLKLLEVIRHYMDGGTAIGKALQVGVAEVGNLKAQGFVGADLVLVSDGEDYRVAEMNKALDDAEREGIDLYTVAIDVSIDKSSPLVQRAKHYIEVNGVQASGGEIATNMPQDFLQTLREAAKGFKLTPGSNSKN